MRNSEVYAYIERLYDVIQSFDAVYSGLPDGDAVNDALSILSDFEEEVRKQMESEAKQKSGFNSTPFFSELALSTDEEIIDFCDRMDEIHPSLGKFMQYLMEEDDPTFFIAYGDKPSLTGRSSDEWGYEASALIFNYFLSNLRGYSDDK